LKQFLRGVDATFDERKFGFETLGDLMRACQRDGLLRVERDRQGGMRIFPGTIGAPSSDATAGSHDEQVESGDGAERQEGLESTAETWSPPLETSPTESESDVVDGDVLQEIDEPAVMDAEEASAVVEKPARRRARAPRAPRASRSKAADAAATAPSASPKPARARKTSPKPRTRRPRGENDTKAD